MAEERPDPYAAFNFRVAITPKSGATIGAAFSEVTGLSSEVTYAEYRDGTDARNRVRKVATIYKVGDITLKRGIIGKDDLYSWLEAVRTGKQDAKATVVIQHLEEGGRTVVGTYTFTNARPSKWTPPSFNAKSTDVAMEELTLVAEDMMFE